MDYDKQSSLVDDICSDLPAQDFPDDENPYHKKMRARGEKMYHLVKLNMGKFKAESSFSQTLQSNVSKNDKKSWASIEGQKDAAITTTKTDAALLFQEKLKVLESAEPRIAALVKEFKIIKAKFSVIPNAEGFFYIESVLGAAAPMQEQLLLYKQNVFSSFFLVFQYPDRCSTSC